MNWSETQELIASDLYRFKGRQGWRATLKMLRKNRSFQITFWMRMSKFLAAKKIPVLKQLVVFQYRRVCRRYCVDLPYETKIGKGLIIYHCYGLVVNEKSIIGNNVMLAHQVTLAFENGGAPVVGDRVRIAPGAKLVGRVRVESDSIVGANAMVVGDVPPNSITFGVPNEVIERTVAEDVDRYFWPTP